MASKTTFPGLSCGVVFVILGLATLVELRLVTDRQTDRQMDRQKHDDSIYRDSIASRGKKQKTDASLSITVFGVSLNVFKQKLKSCIFKQLSVVIVADA